MSVLDSSRPDLPTRKPSVGPAPRLGITQSLDAPGLPVAAPAYNPLAEQLMRSLGLVGDVVGAAGHLSEQERARIARAQAERDRLDEQAKDLDRGQASLAARTFLATTTDAIAARTLRVPPGVAPANGKTLAESHVSSLIDEQVRGLSPAYQERFRAIAEPELVRAFLGQQREVRMDAQKENLQVLGENFVTASSVDDMKSLIERNRAQYPDLTDTEFFSATVLKAAEASARAGNTAGVETASQVLSGRFPAELARARAVLGASIADAGSKRDVEFRNTVAGLYIQNVPFDQVRETIRKFTGAVDNTALDSALQEADTRERQSLSESRKLNDAAFLEAQRAEVHAANLAAIGAGLGSTIEAVDIRRSDGGAVALSRDEQMRDAMNEALVRAAAGAPDPETATARMADLASKNGYIIPSWQRTLVAGNDAASVSALTDGKTGMPPATIAGLSLYRQLGAQNPAYLASMLNGHENARELYELASVLREDPQIGPDDQAALLAARQAIQRPGYRALTDQIATSLDAAVDGVLSRGLFRSAAKNSNEVGGEIFRRAAAYTKVGMKPEEAVARAASLVNESRMTINGWSSPTWSTAIPDSLREHLDPMGRGLIEAYVTAHRSELGVDASDLTLRASTADGYWTIAHGDTGLPVRSFGKPEAMIFSTGELVRLAQAQETSKRLAAESAVLAGRQHIGLAQRTGYKDFPPDFTTTRK